jgi:hypothetical protein
MSLDSRIVVLVRAMTECRELTLLDEIKTALASAGSFEDLQAVRDKAEAMRTYARAAKLGFDIQNQAAELKLRAERAAGQFLTDLHLRGGDRRTSTGRKRPTLCDLGVGESESKRWQIIASVPDAEFEQFVTRANEERKEITAAGVYRVARQLRSKRAKPSVNRCSRRPSAVDVRLLRLESPETLIEELRNHVDLLSQILAPLRVGRVEQIQAGERRAVGHLVNEIKSVIDEIEAAWPSVPSHKDRNHAI